MSETTPQDLFDRHQEVIASAWNGLVEQVLELKLSNAKDFIPSPESAEWSVAVDPFDKSETLTITWLDKGRRKCGEIQVRPDGSFFSEYDVVVNHPSDKRWFVESVTAWGKVDQVKTELRLIPAVQ